MGVIVKNLMGYLDNTRVVDNISFETDGKIVGVVGNSGSGLGKVLLDANCYQGEFFVNGNCANSDKISLVNGGNSFILDNVREEMILYINKKHYKNDDMKSHMSDCLKIVGLNDSYFKRRISSLSFSERLLLSFAFSLVNEPELLIVDNYLEKLDFQNRRMILKLLMNLRDIHGCTVLICSDDSNMVYQYCDMVMVVSNGILECFDTPSIVFTKIDMLKRCNILIPDLINFTYLASFKKIKLSFHKDIRDLIKDVYKHV